MKALFQMHTDANSYKYPIAKICVCIMILCLCFFRGRIFESCSSVLLSALDIVVCLAITILSILCIYVSVGEVFCVYSNRKREKAQSEFITYGLQYTQYPIEELVSLITEADIIECDIVTSKNIVMRIGASADCKPSESRFFDKLYYIDTQEFDAIAEFNVALESIIGQSSVRVLSIDGIPAISYKP